LCIDEDKAHTHTHAAKALFSIRNFRKNMKVSRQRALAKFVIVFFAEQSDETLRELSLSMFCTEARESFR